MLSSLGIPFSLSRKPQKFRFFVPSSLPLYWLCLSPDDRTSVWISVPSRNRRKGTLLGVPHIATGDLVCEELASSGPLSLQLSEIVNQGKLVSDEAGEAKGESGFLLDAFPRTMRQADGRHGKAWGIVHKDGLRAAEASKKISAVHKRCLKYIPNLSKTTPATANSTPAAEVQAT